MFALLIAEQFAPFHDSHIEKVTDRQYHEGGGSAAQHEDRTPTHGYEPTREATMAVFAKSCGGSVTKEMVSSPPRLKAARHS
jgi:hypothetical protein